MPLAQFAFNSSKAATGRSPFFANYGFEPPGWIEPRNLVTLTQKAKLDATRIRELHRELSLDMEFLSSRAAIYYNKKRTEGPDLKEGDLVYLLRKNLKTKRPSSKLDHTKLGPFPVETVHGRLTYRLKLPKDMRIHPVFHISLLEPAPPNAKPATKGHLAQEHQDETYAVEEILDRQLIKGKPHYLIKWSGYSQEENSWEPETNLNPGLAQEYQRQNPVPSSSPQGSHPKRRRRARKHWVAATQGQPPTPPPPPPYQALPTPPPPF